MQLWCKDNGDGSFGDPQGQPQVLVIDGLVRKKIRTHLWDSEEMIAAGYRSYNAPAYDPATQKLGAIVADGGVSCTHDVLAMTQQEQDDYLAAQRSSMLLTKYQLRKGLANVSAQKRSDFEAYVTGSVQAVQDYWFYSDSYNRLDQEVLDMAAALSLSDGALDNFFTNNG